MRPLQQLAARYHAVVWGVAVAALVAALLLSAASVLRSDVLHRGEEHQIAALIEQHGPFYDGPLLLIPGEAFLPFVPDLDFAQHRIFLASKYTRLFPLYLLRDWDQAYLLRDKRFDWRRSNTSKWQLEVVGETADYQLTRSRIQLERLADRFEQFEVFRVVKGVPTPAERIDDTFAYFKNRWDRVRRTQDRVSNVPFDCIALHAEPGFTVRITAPLDGRFRRAQVHTAVRDSGDRKRATQFKVQVTAHGRRGQTVATKTGAFRANILKQWQTVEVNTSGATELTVDISVNRSGRHHLCLMGDLQR